MDSKKYDVFISYRRDGGVDYARMIYLELKGRGYNCFFDYNSLRSGKFNDEIFRAIDECRYFILVLSNGALERCMNEGDWVRREIEFAISKGKDIIPICPSGNVRGFPDVMPRAFEVLRNIQISQLLMDDLFDKSFDKIVEDRFSQDFQKAACDHAGKRKIAMRSRLTVAAMVAVVVVGIVVFLSAGRKNSPRDVHVRGPGAEPLVGGLIIGADGRVLKGEEAVDAKIKVLKELEDNRNQMTEIDERAREISVVRQRLMTYVFSSALDSKDPDYLAAESRIGAFVAWSFGKTHKERMTELDEIKKLYDNVLSRVEARGKACADELKQYLGETFKDRTLSSAKSEYESLPEKYQHLILDDLLRCVERVDGMKIAKNDAQSDLLDDDVAKRIIAEYDDIASLVRTLRLAKVPKEKIVEDRYDLLMKFYDIRRRVEIDVNYCIAVGENEEGLRVFHCSRAALGSLGLSMDIKEAFDSPEKAKEIVKGAR